MIKVLWVALFAISLSAVAADLQLSKYTPSRAEQQLIERLDSAATFTARLNIARDFQRNYPVDVGVQMRAADLLMLDDPDAVLSYYQQRAADNPNSELDLYMAGRYAPELSVKQSYVAKLLTLNQNSYWGALLQATSYPVEDDPDFAKAEAALLRAISLNGAYPYAPSLLGDLWSRTGKKSDAEKLWRQVSDLDPRNFEPVQRRLMLYPGEFKTHLKILDDFLENTPENALAWDVRARVCRELNDWDGYIASMRNAVAAEPDGVNHYNLACGFSQTGSADSAYAHLFAAVKLGLADTEQYTDDEDLIPIKNDQRWPELLAAAEAAGAEQKRATAKQAAREITGDQKQQIVGKRGTTVAPDFTLEQLGGGSVTLSELRGKVVVLDFWATWCGPCRMTMPMIDKFYKNRKSEDVLVFGVNVWERSGTGGVGPFIEKAGYEFPILFGSHDLSEAYGVSGIPSLFVIDKDGKIAFSHRGANPAIDQILDVQTSELLK